LVKLIVENNTSMEKRTIYSQEKLIKKKKAKHLNKIWICDTNMFNIIETNFLQDEKRINFMRMDSFSTMLVNSIFANHANSLIFEEIENILTSIYASKSSPQSNIVSLFNNKIVNRNFGVFNLKKKNKYPISYFEMENFVNENSFFSHMIRRRYSLFFDK